MPIHVATAYIYTSQHEDLCMLCIVVHVQVGDVYMYYIHMFTAIYRLKDCSLHVISSRYMNNLNISKNEKLEKVTGQISLN